MLVVLITHARPDLGAHFNPAVSARVRARESVGARRVGCLCAGADRGGIAGVLVAHGMFDETLFQLSTKARSGPAQWLSEAVAAFGLVLAILLTLRVNPPAVAASVGLYITAAYWFTASTSFANPAVTVARAISDTFAGIRPADVAPFIVAQFVGAVAGMFVSRWLAPGRRDGG